MKHALISGLILFSGLAFADASHKDPFKKNTTEYVRVCSLFGAGWYYIPGSDTCFFDSTGETRYINSHNVVVYGQSQLAYRVTQLEHKLFGSVQEKEESKTETTQSVEYVKACPLYGDANWYYIPGSDTCVNPLTGVTKKQTSEGTVKGQTVLAYRISQLEKKLMGSAQTSTTQKDMSANFHNSRVEYVPICTLYGSGWYYLSQEETTCLFPATGETRRESIHHGTIVGQSELARRVSQLEQQLAANEDNNSLSQG